MGANKHLKMEMDELEYLRDEGYLRAEREYYEDLLIEEMFFEEQGKSTKLAPYGKRARKLPRFIQHYHSTVRGANKNAGASGGSVYNRGHNRRNKPNVTRALNTLRGYVPITTEERLPF